MSRILRPTRHDRVRCRPRLERLESRRLFDAAAQNSVLSVVQTTPALGAVLTQSPTDLLIQFNQPFDPISLGQDIVLEQVSRDGTAMPMDFSVIMEPFSLSAPTDTLDVTVAQRLQPGHYRIVLSQYSSLAGLRGQPLANQGGDQTLADFTVREPGVTLADATDLKTPGATPEAVSSSLDFRTPQGEVRLYKFTLPASQPLWRLGAEVSAQRDGGTLLTSLALLDAQGHLIATGDTGDQGRLGAPEDPFLFAGLKPGTYYLGVSGSGDLPGQSDGYDPVTGTPGSVVQAQPGGAFRLHVAADPAKPTTLLSFQLDQADPLDPRPTGVTLTFSGPLSLDSLRASSTFQALQVVDQSGKAWSLTLSSYVESECRFTFLFDRWLPQGHYSLIVPARDGATDLVGQAPVAPGEPAGVLATWDVAASSTTPNPYDLSTLLNQVGLTDTLAPGESVTYRFVITSPGAYFLATQYSGGALTIQRNGSDGLTKIDAGTAGTSQFNVKSLVPGVYHLQLSNPGNQPTQVSWSFTENDLEAILSNGVGQGPALDLMLIAPTVPTPTPTPTPAPGSPVVNPAPAPSVTTAPTAPTHSEGPSAGHADPASSGTATGSRAAGLVLTLGGSLVGSPSLRAESVAAVGPGTSSNTTALALNSAGVIQGINYGPVLGSSWGSHDDAAPSRAEPVPAPSLDGALVVGTAPGAPGADDHVLAINELIGQIGPAVLDWVALPFRGAPAVEVHTAGAPDVRGEPGAPPEPIALVRDDTPAGSSEAIDRADLSAPLGFVAITVGVMRLRRPLHGWFRRKGLSPAPHSSTLGTITRGPHIRF